MKEKRVSSEASTAGAAFNVWMMATTEIRRKVPKGEKDEEASE